MQLKSRERRVFKNLEQKTSYSRTITKNMGKSYLIKIDKNDWFKIDCPREWYLRQHPVFQASTNVLDKMKTNQYSSDLIPSEPEKQDATEITAIVANNATSFVWQKFNSYEKLLRIVVYMLRSLAKFAYIWTETGSNTDPAE